MVGHCAVAADPGGKGPIPVIESVINGTQLERDLGKLEKKLTMDFGPGDSLRPLFGKCVSKSVCLRVCV